MMDIYDLVERLTAERPVAVPKLLREAVAQKESITPLLLDIIKLDTDRFDYIESHSEYGGHIYSIFLLAQFREARSYPLIVNFFSVPDNDYYGVFGEMVTEDLPEIFASVYDGNDTALYKLIENPNAYEFCRDAALNALVHLVRMNLKSCDSVLEYINELLIDRLEKVRSAAWLGAVNAASSLGGLQKCMTAIRKAYADGLVDPFCISLRDLEEDMRQDPVELLRSFRSHHPVPITDVPRIFESWEKEREAEELQRAWRQQENLLKKSGVLPNTSQYFGVPQGDYSESLYGNPAHYQTRTLPNDPCPCLSGRKYKKCCGRVH